jgi:hypothetical protein
VLVATTNPGTNPASNPGQEWSAKISRKWRRVHIGLSLCWFGSALAAAALSLILACWVGVGPSRDLPPIIQILVAVAFFTDLIGRLICTAIPESTCRKRAVTATLTALTLPAIILGGAYIRTLTDELALLALARLVLEFVSLAASAIFWLRFLIALSKASQAAGLGAKLSVFMQYFKVLIGVSFALTLIGVTLAISNRVALPLAIGVVVTLCAALYLFLRHLRLLSSACEVVHRRASAFF